MPHEEVVNLAVEVGTLIKSATSVMLSQGGWSDLISYPVQGYLDTLKPQARQLMHAYPETTVRAQDLMVSVEEWNTAAWDARLRRVASLFLSFLLTVNLPADVVHVAPIIGDLLQLCSCIVMCSAHLPQTGQGV